MCVAGKLLDQQVLILIDNGSARNFLSHAIVAILRISMDPLPPLNVQMGNWDIMACEGVCKSIPAERAGGSV